MAVAEAEVKYRALLIVSVALVTAAFIELPHVKLFNDTGAPLVLHLNKGLEGAETDVDERVRLKPGGAKHFMAWRMRARFRVSSGACDYFYTFPRMAANSPWGYGGADGRWVHGDGRFPVKVQVEPDLTAYLLPDRARGIMP